MGRRPWLLLVVLGAGIFAVATTWLGNHMTKISEGARALGPRSFPAPTVVFVGTGGSYANPLRRGPALAFGAGGDVVLLDVGRGAAEGLRAAQIPAAQLRAVLLTSLLPENTVGLDDVLFAGWLEPRTGTLRVLGPPGTRALVAGIAAAHRAGAEAQGAAIGLPDAGARLEAVELADDARFEEGSLRVRAAALPGGPLPALAYRLEVGAASVVGVGAAWGADALVELARGANLLVHEAHFADSVEMAIEAGASEPERLRREAALRTPLAEAGARATRAGVGALALVRLRPPPLFEFQARRGVGSGFRGRIFVPEDGGELELTP
jgi:ribonuclease BN (tRNA processing enzyme)